MSGSIGSHFVTRDEEKECKHDCYIQRTKARVGVFENNESAHWCYKKAGFVDMKTVKSEPWDVIEMEIKKEVSYDE